MIKHPTKREQATWNIYKNPSVEATYATAGLGVLSVPEKSENNWIAQKSHKSHFHLPGKSSPSNNTELLIDGSAQARAILSIAKDAVEEAATSIGSCSIEALGVLGHALDYLKGKDVNNLGMWTKDFFEEDEDVPPTAD